MASEINTFKSLEQVKAISKMTKRFQNNEVVYITDEQAYYYYQNKKWLPMPDKIKVSGEGATINLYEMNKQIMSQLPLLTDLKPEMEKISKWRAKNHSSTRYFTLMCKEKSYFTIFTRSWEDTDFASFGEAVVSCAQDIGDIVSIDVDEDPETAKTSNVEIWFKDFTDEVHCAILFDSDKMFVTYEV